MPLGIGSELWEFKPCADPVCGMPSALYRSGALRLGDIVMPRAIGAASCGLTP
jgi:hypothetical protein